jgi:hypothetical protein
VIVPDASAVLELLLGTPVGLEVARPASSHGAARAAPHRRRSRAGAASLVREAQLTVEDAADAFRIFGTST